MNGFVLLISQSNPWLSSNPPLLYVQSVENLPTVFGSNSKAQMAAKAVFDLAHRHGNILREGWKNIMDSMLQLFRSELLPKAMVEVRAPHALFHVVGDEVISGGSRFTMWW